MDLKLAGKTALVTGGSKGIGRAAAEILAGEGYNVIIVSRSADGLATAKSAVDTTDNEPVHHSTRSGRANAIISLSRWYKKSVRPVNTVGFVFGAV